MLRGRPIAAIYCAVKRGIFRPLRKGKGAEKKKIDGLGNLTHTHVNSRVTPSYLYTIGIDKSLDRKGCEILLTVTVFAFSEHGVVLLL